MGWWVDEFMSWWVDMLTSWWVDMLMGWWVDKLMGWWVDELIGAYRLMGWRQIWQVVMWFGWLMAALQAFMSRRDLRGCMHYLQLTPVPLSQFRLSQLETVFPLERGVIDFQCDAWFGRANCLYFAPDLLRLPCTPPRSPAQYSACVAHTRIPHACKPRGGMIFDVTHDWAGRGYLTQMTLMNFNKD